MTTSSSFDEVLDALKQEVSAFAETTHRLAEVSDSILGAPEALARFFSIDIEAHTAGGTVQLRARLEVAEPMLALLAAVRAGNVQLGVIEQCLGHPNLSCALTPGVDAESRARETSPAATRDAEGRA